MDNIREQLKEKIFQKFQKDTWEIKTLGEIATDIYSGDGVSKEQLGGGNYPAIKAGDVNGDLNLIFEECISFVNIDEIKNKKYFEHGDLLMSHFGDKDTVATTCAYVGKEKCLAGKNIYVIKHSQNPKYLAYALSSEFSRKQIQNLSSSSIVIYLYMKEMKKIKIPLPPLEIQNQISDFLDKYIELERELEMRKKQHEYYKNLVFNRGIVELKWEMRSIEEIASDIYSGNGIIKEQLGTGDFPAIRFKKIHDSLIEIKDFTGFVNPDLVKNKKFIERGDLLITQISENLEESGKACVYLGKQKCLAGNHITIIKSPQNSKFLSFYLSTDSAKYQIKQLAQKSTVYVLYSSKIKQIKIPLPPLDVQERIAEDLDKLYRIVHDLKEGIPFLIQKYREEYETYRDLLLEK